MHICSSTHCGCSASPPALQSLFVTWFCQLGLGWLTYTARSSCTLLWCYSSLVLRPSRSSHTQPSFRPPVQQVQRYCGSIPWSTCWVLGFLPFWNIKLYISHLVSKHSLTDKWIIVIAKQPHFWQQMAELPEVRLLLQASNEAMTCE